jgi:hypothetical protein
MQMQMQMQMQAIAVHRTRASAQLHVDGAQPQTRWRGAWEPQRRNRRAVQQRPPRSSTLDRLEASGVPGWQ